MHDFAIWCNVSDRDWVEWSVKKPKGISQWTLNHLRSNMSKHVCSKAFPDVSNWSRSQLVKSVGCERFHCWFNPLYLRFFQTNFKLFSQFKILLKVPWNLFMNLICINQIVQLYALGSLKLNQIWRVWLPVFSRSSVFLLAQLGDWIHTCTHRAKFQLPALFLFFFLLNGTCASEVFNP